MQETWIPSLVCKVPWSKKWQPAPVFLPGKLHRQGSFAGYSPWVCKESTQLSTMHTHSKCYTYIDSFESPFRYMSLFYFTYLVPGRLSHLAQTLFSWAPKSLQMVTCSCDIKKTLAPWEKGANLESILESREITLPTKVCIVKAIG